MNARIHNARYIQADTSQVDDITSALAACMPCDSPQTIDYWASFNRLQYEISLRRRRDEMFGKSTFKDPIWGLFLVLAKAEFDGRKTLISELGHASELADADVAQHLDHLVKNGLVCKERDSANEHLASAVLSPRAISLLIGYFNR